MSISLLLLCLLFRKGLDFVIYNLDTCIMQPAA